MKLLPICIFLLVSFNTIGQAPKKPSINQLVKNKVISATRNSLALPKYFKFEKVTATLDEKSKINTIETGENEIPIDEIFNSPNNPNLVFKAKYIDYIEVDENDEKIQRFYKLDSIVKDEAGYFLYHNDGEAVYLTENTSDLKLFSKSKKSIYKTSTWYTTEIYYWAMSNGGTIRLYHDEGLVGIDSKGKLSYTLLEDK